MTTRLVAVGRILLFVALVALGLAMVIMAAACSSEERPGERRLAVWSEFLDDTAVREALPLLQAEGADLYLAVPVERIGDPSLAQLIRDADAVGVGVRAWLLLDEADGYWPNEHNIDEMRSATMAFADWRESAALPVQWLIFDMEMSLQRTRAIADEIEANGTLSGLEMVKEGRDPQAFELSRAAFASLVQDLQARDLKVMAVTYPTILDDAEDGDDDIQDQLDVPITGVPWDQTSFMVYQSLIYDLSGEWHGPDVIASYAASAVEQFGDRAAVAIGIIGSAGITPVAMPYPDVETLLTDYAAARSVGTPVSVYSLDGIMTQPEPDAWLDRDVAPVEPVEVTSEFLRNLIRGLMD